MPMLDASNPTFRQRYPNGATVRDRLGRQLQGVLACDPETGEVIRHDKSRIVGAFLRMVRGREQNWELSAEFRRHGFYPAPLTIKPRQWLHIGLDEPLPVIDDRTPGRIYGYGDDGLYGH